MATAIRTIKHEDRLSLIEHLDELRTRLIVSAIALAVAFGFCLWQNHALLHLINKPLEKQTQKQVKSGNGPLGQVALTQKALLAVSTLERETIATLSAPGSGVSPAAAAKLAALAGQIDTATAKIPRVPTGDKPVTLGIGEPFTTTITVTFYFALLFSLPVILFQLYSFILPAFSPGEREIALPLMLAIPFLFATGVIFAYFVVVPASVKFFQNFNSEQFNVLVQAGPYLKFVTLLMLAMGLIFQVPVGILAATRAGMITPKQLRSNRRYAVVVAAVIVALLPGDLVTMALEAAPLIVLYELSIAIASFVDRRVKRREAREAAAAAARTDGGPGGAGRVRARPSAGAAAGGRRTTPGPAGGPSGSAGAGGRVRPVAERSAQLDPADCPADKATRRGGRRCSLTCADVDGAGRSRSSTCCWRSSSAAD